MLDKGVDAIFNKDYELDFNEITNGIKDLDPRIDSVVQLK